MNQATNSNTILTSITTIKELITSATVEVYDNNQRLIPCRALLDTCSTANFITERLATKLQLPKQRVSIPIGALNDLETISKHSMKVTFKSIHNQFEKRLNFLTVPRIADRVPSESISRDSIVVPANIRLADPEFFKSSSVDLLIGSGPTLSMFCLGQIDLSNRDRELVMQKTRLGWIVGGSIMQKPQSVATCFYSDLNKEVAQFWEIEEGSSNKRLSPDEIECEEHFNKHITRNKDGRYVVALPFKREPSALGDSYQEAIKRLSSLRRKFQGNNAFKQQYEDVLTEYSRLGHLTKTKRVTKGSFVLPHHAVIKESSATTKVRVVFDGSAKSSTGVSLNDLLHVGPTIQDDIFSLILRFRTHRYVITADIEKMYRQFLVRSEDRKYQQILWQGNEKLDTYELNTVTFGLSCAPYLAIRCLHQLAADEGNQYPLAAASIKNDMYVDDLLTGAETITEAKQLQSDLQRLLQLGGMKLRQWASNERTILDEVPEEDVNQTLHLDKDQPLKTLGVVWNATEDEIRYTVKPIPKEAALSKRKILSQIAKIYDPLGLLGPVIFLAKLIMQQLWLVKVEWDESVPQSIYQSWTNYCEELPMISEWSDDRQVIIPGHMSIQLHGFSDASEKGFGACIFIRSEDAQGRVLSRLLCAKSRVAPLKNVTLPRLELCAAQLLAKLAQQAIKTMKIQVNGSIFWTDSMITLHWIYTPPHLLKTFVANRVADIQENTNKEAWRHIPSKDNPADALSRGLTPSELLNNSLWKHGPQWLSSDQSQWPKAEIQIQGDDLEKKKTCCYAITVKCDIFKRFSTFDKLRRVIAYCLRFRPDNKSKGTLSAAELRNAEARIINIIQTTEFEEVHDLKNQKEIKHNSKLKSLSPFLDTEGILRVGGRLENATLPYSQRHPAILPRSNHVTDLIITAHHIQNYHSGVQATLYSVRRAYWLIDGRRQVRKSIRRCITCFRASPLVSEYKMGNLPKIRVTEARPFVNVGVDYCGPFYMKERKIRNRAKVKVYIAIFVCLVVKAIHVEIVSDLRTDGFMGALRRFIARRGKPNIISSDNGTNFIGARNELEELYATINSQAHQDRISQHLSEQGIEWRFIPPLSPNFGGLWESAVKSFKHHFRRVMKNELFTFEEMNTLLIEIEAILNSRPLTPLSSDPNDLIVLTPGHFLIGDALTSLPFSDYETVPSNRLSRWEHLIKIRQDFWNRWRKEYLNELNIRTKWTSGSHAIKEGTIVLLKEDHVPPMRWPLGRIIKVQPGSDGVIRTATVKTASSTFERNIQRLAPLPIDDKEII